MKYMLLVPVTPKKSRLYLTVLGSVAFHATLIGVAALWPSHAVAKKNPGPTILVPIDDGANDSPVATPESSTPEPVPDALPSPAEPAPQEVGDEAVPSYDPEMVAPVMPVPVARPLANRVRTNPAASANVARPATGPVGPRAGSSGSLPGTGRVGVAGRWNVSSKPPYPMALKKASVHGSGTVRITTDASGHVVEAAMIQSTGSSVLDENTTRHAKAFWTGPGSATTTVPITYQLQ